MSARKDLMKSRICAWIVIAGAMVGASARTRPESPRRGRDAVRMNTTLVEKGSWGNFRDALPTLELTARDSCQGMRESAHAEAHLSQTQQVLRQGITEHIQPSKTTAPPIPTVPTFQQGLFTQANAAVRIATTSVQ